MVRAGWSGPRLRASKFSHSASTIGPSATSQPIATKTSAIRSDSVVIGCRAPRGRAVPGQRDVDGLLDQHPLLGLGLELGLARGEGLVDRAAGLADPRPASLRACGGSAPISRLASASGERSPACVGADLLERVEVGGRRDRGQRLVAHRVDVLLVERGDLDRVVLGVGARHGCLSLAVRSRCAAGRGQV